MISTVPSAARLAVGAFARKINDNGTLTRWAGITTLSRWLDRVIRPHPTVGAMSPEQGFLVRGCAPEGSGPKRLGATRLALR